MSGLILADVGSVKEPEPWPKTIELAEGGTFKLTFTVVDTTSGEAVYPKQAHLLFQDLKGEEDVTLPVTVKDNGKAGFTIVGDHGPHNTKDRDNNANLIDFVEHGQTTSCPLANTRSILTHPPPLITRIYHNPPIVPARSLVFTHVHPPTHPQETT